MAKNERGAGRKPLPITKTNIKATVPNELLAQWERVEKKTEFIREAIAMKLQSTVEYIPYTPQELLIVKVELGTDPDPKYFAQTKSGAVFRGASAYPDENGDLCLMQVFPGEGIEGESFSIPGVWSVGAAEKALPRADEWHVEIRGCFLQ